MKKNSYLHFRVNKYELDILKTIADLEHRNISEMLRELLREGYTNRVIYPSLTNETGQSSNINSRVRVKEVAMSLILEIAWGAA